MLETMRRVANRKTIQSATRLFWEGQRVDYVYWVLSGAVKAVVHPSSGKRITLFDVGAGEMVGEDQVTRDFYRYTATVSESGEFLVVAKDVFLREIGSPLYLETLSQKVNKLINNFERLAIPSAEERTMNFLRSISNNAGFAQVKGRVNEFSDVLHLTPETIYRTFKKLEKRGEIERLTDGNIRVTI